MNQEFLLGMSTIPCYPYGTIHVLTLKQNDIIYCDFYKIQGDSSIFIDHIELDDFCYRIGYQLINDKLIIYSYDIVPGKKRQCVKELYKFYDIKNDISINYNVREALNNLGFSLTDTDKKIYKTKEEQKEKLEEYISYLENISNETGITPLVNGENSKKKYKTHRKYQNKLLYPISRIEFTEYITNLLTKSDDKLKVNKKVIDIHDYFNKKY